MADNPIPMPVLRMLRHPGGSKVLSTLGEDGYPHSVVLAGLVVDDDGLIYVGEAFMYRAKVNLERDPRAEIVAWRGKDGYSFKVDAVGRVTEGPRFDEVNEALGKKGMSAAAVWVFKPCQVWDESASYTSGDRVIRWSWPAPGGSPAWCSTWRRSARSPAWAWRSWGTRSPAWSCSWSSWP